MANKKHYIITAVTLGIIAASSGALIGLTNLITHDRIDYNKKQKIKTCLVKIFGDDAVSLKDEDYKLGYVTHYYDLGDGKYAFQTTGSNTYGKLELIIGVQANTFVRLYSLNNEQTYASTLEENYITLINREKNKRDYTDVSCGATYGASLARDMVEDAIKASIELSKKE